MGFRGFLFRGLGFGGLGVWGLGCRRVTKGYTEIMNHKGTMDSGLFFLGLRVEGWRVEGLPGLLEHVEAWATFLFYLLLLEPA